MFRTIRSKTITQKSPFIIGLVLALAVLTSGAGLVVHKASAGDCDSNAIIHCGFSSPSAFISDIRNGDEVGHKDLADIYAHQFVSGQFLTSSMYADFASHAVAGTAYKNGTIIVDGKQVATGVSSIGRLESYQGSNPQVYPNVAGRTYYGNVNAKAFASDGLPVYVLFDNQGTMQFAVMKGCGNPEFGTVVKTSASCNALQKTPVAGQLNEYAFTASGNVSGNAKITKYVYNFGDGTPAVTTTNGSTPVRHLYTKASPAGGFRASVTEYASVPGNANLQLPTISMCTKMVVVTLPSYNCLQTTAVLADSTNKYRYTLKTRTSAVNGAKFNKVIYAVDSHTITSTAADGSATYTAVSKGGHVVTATAYFTVPDKSGLQPDTSAGCHITVTVVPPLYECSGLSSTFINDDKTNYRFVATAKYDKGVVPLSASFNFGDGSSATGVKPNGNTFTADHKYSKAGNYNISAQLYFTVPGQSGVSAANFKCTGQASPSGFVQTCKPGIPVGDVRCNPCPTNPAVPADDTADCVPATPPVLPNTGAGNTIAIFAAVVIAAFLVYRQLLFRRHKAAFAAAQLGTSPLPLGDPLSETPLADTPLAPKRRSFRRPRQF